MSGGSISISSSSSARRLVLDDDGEVVHRVAEAARDACEGVGDERVRSGAGHGAVLPRGLRRLPVARARAGGRDVAGAKSQSSRTAQRSQSGFGLQMRRPCRISVSDARVHRSRGSAPQSCCSTLDRVVRLGDADAVRRRAARGDRRAAPARRARGRARRSRSCGRRRAASTSASMSAGTSPPCRATSASAMPIERTSPSARKKPVDVNLRLELLGGRASRARAASG